MTDDELAQKLRETAGLLNHFLHVAKHRKLSVSLAFESTPLLRISDISISRSL